MPSRFWLLLLLLSASAIADDENNSDPDTEPAASEEAAGVRFGGPNAVDNQLETDAAPVKPLSEIDAFRGYFEWQARMKEEHGFSFGMDYSAAYLGASDSPGEDSAASGMVRFYGSWDLTGRGTADTGAFIYKIEHRHRYGDVVPKFFGFEIGYAGLFLPPFSDDGARMTNLYWRQRFNQGRATVMAGLLDPTDYVDAYGLASPWTGFSNFVFSTGSAVIGLPNDAALGIAGATMLGESFYVIAGLADGNSDPTEPFETFNTFFDESQFFSSIELGWTPSHGQLFLHNAHLTLWHSDEFDFQGTPDGWGANFHYGQYINEKWFPFVRAGYADEAGGILQKSLTLGFGYQPVPARDLLGWVSTGVSPTRRRLARVVGISTRWKCSIVSTSPGLLL